MTRWGHTWARTEERANGAAKRDPSGAVCTCARGKGWEQLQAGLETDILVGAASQRREHGLPIFLGVFWIESPHLIRVFLFVCL